MAGEQGFRVEALPATHRYPTLVKESVKSALKCAGRFWPLLFAPLLVISLLDRFPYSSANAPYSDLTISHYPNALYLLRSIREWGQIPLWSSSILGGYPFAANPLSGLWYPPGWLALLLPLPLGFNLTLALHLLWGGIGMYRFLRIQGLSHAAGLCGALAFEAMPKLFAHYGAGHLTLLYAVPWTPWLLWAWQRVQERKMGKESHAGVEFLPGILLGTIFLADVRWASYAGVLWVAWAFAHSQFRTPFSTLSNLLRQTFITILLSAPLVLPLLEYTRLSTRAGLASQEVLSHSLPPVRLLGIFFPGVQGSHEWMVYPGAAVLVLALYALWVTRQKTRRTVWFWMGTAGLGIFVALGSIFPVLDRLAGLPGVDLLRVPSRALFLSGMALAILAAYGLDHLLGGLTPGEIRYSRLALAGLNFFTLGLALVLGLQEGELPANLGQGGLLILAASFWSWIGTPLLGKRTSAYWLTGLLLIACIDLGMIDRQVLTGREFGTVIAEGEAAAAYLAGKPGRFRVYSPSYSLPQQTAAKFGLEMLDGVDPLQLESVARFMERASGVPRGGYSVTAPPFANGEPALDNRDFRPDPEQLGLLNVAYVVSEFDLPVEGLVLQTRIGETRVYENTYSRPRAWIQGENPRDSLHNLPNGEINWTPNEITVHAGDPGLLVLSEIAYPGWEVWVDGARKELQVAEGLLRTVRLGPGEHTVVFRYRPASLLIGLGLFGAAILFLLARSLLCNSAAVLGRKGGKG